MTEKKVRWFWKNPDRGYVYWQIMLIAAIAASCGFNGAHAALDTHKTVGHVVAAVFGAVIPPMFFFAVAEGVLMIWHRALSRVGTFLLGTLVLAAGVAAGSRSFFGLVDFSARFDTLPADHRSWLVYMLPLVTDALALGATVALFELKGAPERRTRKKVKKQEEDIATIGVFPKLRITLFGGAATAPKLPVVNTPSTQVTPPTTPRRQVIDSPPTTPKPVVSDTLATPAPVTDTLSSTVSPTVETVSDIDADSLQFAAVVAERAKVKQSPETVARVIEALRESNGNLSHAANSVSLSRDPARRIKVALEEMEAEPTLTAVG